MTSNRQVMMTYISVWNPARYETGGKTMKIRTKMAPAMNSTSGYCQEILLLHFLHDPFWNKKLKIGTNSFHVSPVPHDMHFDRPPKPTPVLKRKETTFKKLPTTVPKMKDSRVGRKYMY